MHVLFILLIIICFFIVTVTIFELLIDIVNNKKKIDIAKIALNSRKNKKHVIKKNKK